MLVASCKCRVSSPVGAELRARVNGKAWALEGPLAGDLHEVSRQCVMLVTLAEAQWLCDLVKFPGLFPESYQPTFRQDHWADDGCALQNGPSFRARISHAVLSMEPPGGSKPTIHQGIRDVSGARSSGHFIEPTQACQPPNSPRTLPPIRIPGPGRPARNHVFQTEKVETGGKGATTLLSPAGNGRTRLSPQTAPLPHHRGRGRRAGVRVAGSCNVVLEQPALASPSGCEPKRSSPLGPRPARRSANPPRARDRSGL
jgi:hypothetical protein